MSGRILSAERGSERLAGRRRLRRRRILIAFCILFLLLLGAAIYGLQQSAVRISHIQIFGSDEPLSAYAAKAIQGSYLGIIPRDSIFFFPETRIRADLLAASPDIAAVSIFQNGLTSISIKVDTRVPVARWCGATRSDLNATSSRSGLVAPCYFFDVKGFLYATTSATMPMNPFVIYEPLPPEADPPSAGASPIGLTLPNAEKLPSAFDFARQLTTLGSPVTHIVFRDDEVDNYLASGTRITYVLGDEQNAFTALVSARANLNLADGSLEYVDVRFDGKVYVKRKQ